MKVKHGDSSVAGQLLKVWKYLVHGHSNDDERKSGHTGVLGRLW